MADLSIGKFVGGIVSALVATILFVTLVPIIADNQVAETVENAGAINGLLNVIPILIAVSLIIGVIGIFILKRN